MTCICVKLVNVIHANCFTKSNCHFIYFKIMSLNSLKIVGKVPNY